MKNKLSSLLTTSLIVGSAFVGSNAFAVGTLAGTDVSNIATVTYGPAGNTTTDSSAPAVFTVAEVININVTALDAGANINVIPGETSAVQAYQVTNLGNGDESYNLQSSSAGDFSPTSQIYYELVTPTTVFGFDNDGTETIYGTLPSLDPDQEYYVYIVSNIPAGAVVGDTSTLQLIVTSATPGASGAAVGTVLPTGEIVAVTGGTTNGSTTFTVILDPTTVVTISKTIDSVTANVGGTTVTGQYIPGATVKYLISVVVTGDPAEELTISDTLPSDTTYVANTLVHQIDGSGYASTAPAVGNITSGVLSINFNTGTPGTTAAGTYDIQFDVTIN